LPTIIVTDDNFKLVIHTRGEHEPRHIHVWKAGRLAIVNLGDNDQQHPWLAEVRYGMSKKDAKQAVELVKQNKGFLWRRWDEIWREIHGERNE
jgi:hypothetical protein